MADLVPAIHAERHRKRFLEEMARYINDFSISREPAERLGMDTRDKPAHDESRRMPHLRARGFAPLAMFSTTTGFCGELVGWPELTKPQCFAGKVSSPLHAGRTPTRRVSRVHAGSGRLVGMKFLDT